MAIRSFGEVKSASRESTHFIVEVRGTDLVVRLLSGKFKATYGTTGTSVAFFNSSTSLPSSVDPSS